MSDKAEFTFTWMIENFNLFPPKTGISLNSPSLLLRHFLNTNWNLRLGHGSDESKSTEYISLYLYRCNDNGPEKVEVQCVVTIYNTRSKLQKYNYAKNGGYGWTKFIRRSEIEDFPVLIVECHMKMYSTYAVSTDDTEESTNYFMPSFLKSQFMTPELIKETYIVLERGTSTMRKALQLYSNQGFVRTRVSVEKRILTCAIKDYLGPGSKRKQHIPIALPSATVIITLFMTKMKEAEDEIDILEIEIGVENVHKSHCWLVCKIELIDFERNNHIDYVNRHYFMGARPVHVIEKEHLFVDEDDKTWKYGHFKWNVVKKMKEPSLRFTLAYSEGQCFSDIEWTTGVDDCVGLLKCPNDVSKDLHRMFIEKRLCDVTVRVQNKSIEVHKTVLGSRSPVFAAMFESGMKENNTNVIEIDDLDSNTVSQMLNFMYTGIIKELNAESAMQLFSAADKYQIISLKDTCRNILRNLTLQNICSILVLANTHHDDDLLECSVRFISYHRNEILKSEKWLELEDSNVSLVIDTLKKICLK